MADWLEIPNLRIKSTQFFAYLIQEKVLGLEIPVQSYMPRSRRSLFVTYAIASYLYRWVVTFSIIYFLSQVLKPYKLQSISYMLALGSLVPLLGMPVYQIGQVRSHAREDAQGEKGTCGRVFAVAAVAIVAGILLIPTPLRIQGTLVLTPAKPEEIYAEVEGRLVELNVRDGEWVKKGTVLATLSTPRSRSERVAAARSSTTSTSPRPSWYDQSSDREHRAWPSSTTRWPSELEPVDREDQRADRQADPRRRPRRPGRWACPTPRRSASGSSPASRSARSATPTSSRPT